MLPNLRNALLIHNPNAGNGGRGRRRMLDEARRIFALSGIEAELQETRGPGDATAMAERATREGRHLVIACGGDGTLNEVVNGLANEQNGHRVPMALLPGGTANVLAKELKAAGRKVICYFSAGSYEPYRPDAADFAAADLGNELVGWPGERWLDTRSNGVRVSGSTPATRKLLNPMIPAQRSGAACASSRLTGSGKTKSLRASA